MHENLAANTTYYYWITAVNAGGESDYSLQTSALTPPAAPSNMRVVSTTTNSVTIAWDAVDGAVQYRASGAVTGTLTNTSLQMINAASNTFFTFYIEAINSAGKSGPKANISAQTK